MGDLPVYVLAFMGGKHWQDDDLCWHYMPDLSYAEAVRISSLFPEAAWALSGPELIRMDRPTAVTND
jgi:hypothetical protein